MLSLQEFPKGATIFNQGETGAPYFYIILKGGVSITQEHLVKDSKGELVPKEVVLAYLTHGQSFGELAIISHAPRSFDFSVHLFSSF
jgi:CRP-like cAMP-binding protein